MFESNASTRFLRARSAPYFYRDMMEIELEKLVLEGTLEPVEHSDWAIPIVAVLKPDKQRVRICGDFKQTVNPVAKLDKYPIPRVEDLFVKLAGGKAFTKLDLSQAYLQLPLDEIKRVSCREQFEDVAHQRHIIGAFQPRLTCTPHV